MNWSKIFSISRPRFWVYVLGTFLVGFAAGGDPRMYSIETVLVLVGLFVFFTFPANILIYGVNDIFDYETDVLNAKKTEYEELVRPAEHRRLRNVILTFCLPFLLLILWLPAPAAWALIIFVFTGIFYSAKPIRAKVKPPLDIIFSGTIYISPAVVAYLATGRTDVAWLAVVGGLLWAFAMQSYSAVPDIQADREAGIRTLATMLGCNGMVLTCLLMYAGAGYIGYLFIGPIAIAMGLVYVLVMIRSLHFPDRIFKYYKMFPVINSICGFVLFWILVFQFLV